LANNEDVADKPNYHFIKADITDAAHIDALFAEHQFDGVLHLAAESHVDRSISDPLAFVKTNVIGTVNLLQAAKNTGREIMRGKGSTTSQQTRFTGNCMTRRSSF